MITTPAAAVQALVAEMLEGPRFTVVDNLSVTEPETPSDVSGAFVMWPMA
jgi:hypothetical protein